MALADLPEACIATVLSFTSPRDACRLSLVSSTFRSAAQSDALWETFLPPDYLSILSRSSSPPPSFPSKKHLFLTLADQPLLIDGGLKSFSLDKSCGKKCYMLSARDLFIVWGDTPRYWRWTSVAESRFEEVAELVSVCWLEIRGWIKAQMLSPSTLYAAYLVFKLSGGASGFEYQPVEVSFGIAATEADTQKRTVYLDAEGGRRLRYQIVPRRAGLFNRSRIVGFEAPRTPIPSQNLNPQYPTKRSDGWLEIELGDFFNQAPADDNQLEIALYEVKGGDWKGGLIIQGFEVRPKLNQ